MVNVFLSLQLYWKKFDSKSLFTDTDNFTYEIISEDVYENFFKHKHLFDLSNSSKDSKFLMLSVKELLAKWNFCTKENESITLLD